MDVGGKVLHFFDLSITISNNRLETSVYSKPTDAHLYLNAGSCHPRSQVLGIPKGVALRLRRICSDEVDFKVKSEEYMNYLVQCGHDENSVRSTFQEVSNLTRKEARVRKKKCESNACVLSVKYNPRAPDIGKIIKKHLVIIENDEVAKKILPAKVVRVAYKRNANLKELLAPTNPYKNKIKDDGSGCFRCEAKRCDCCKNFLVTGDTFRSFITNKVFRIESSLTCTSPNVVYLAKCVDCGLQGVGSSVNFKRRLANYKSHIKQRRRTCGIVNHFLDCHDADHSNLKFMLIAQSHGGLRECENFWIGTLLTNQKGMNNSHDFVQQ